MIDYENKLIDNQKRILEDEFNEKIRVFKEEDIDPNMLSNNVLTLETAKKMIAQLVVENADMKRRIINTIEHLKLKQARLINEKDYIIDDLGLDEIMRDLESQGE